MLNLIVSNDKFIVNIFVLKYIINVWVLRRKAQSAVKIDKKVGMNIK